MIPTLAAKNILSRVFMKFHVLPVAAVVAGFGNAPMMNILSVSVVATPLRGPDLAVRLINIPSTSSGVCARAHILGCGTLR